MQDLGRAKNNGQAQKEVADNRHYMSCLNGHLLFKQVNPTRKLKGLDHQPGIMCKPCIDYKGDVHLSESCNCPSFGNVNDDYMLDIFNNLRESKPCCKCALGQKWLREKERLIVLVDYILITKDAANRWYFSVSNTYGLCNTNKDYERYKSYESALSAGIEAALELIKKETS